MEDIALAPPVLTGYSLDGKSMTMPALGGSTTIKAKVLTEDIALASGDGAIKATACMGVAFCTFAKHVEIRNLLQRRGLPSKAPGCGGAEWIADSVFSQVDRSRPQQGGGVTPPQQQQPNLGWGG